MTRRIARVAVILLALACAAQAQIAPAGAIVIKGKAVKGTDKTRSPLARKRFYLFAGSLKDNQGLVDRIKAAEITSRDCFYTQAKASPCLIRWLQEENCESPFCRTVKQTDVGQVKEFQDAYNKGLVAYNKRPDLALAWIVNNLPSDIVTGFYTQQKSAINNTLAGIKPLQSLMTTSTAVEATFPGLAVGKFTISNVLPVEIDNKSYVWACEVDVAANKSTSLPLSVDPKKKGCVLTIKDLKKCSTGACELK